MAEVAYHGWQAKMQISGNTIGVVNDFEIVNKRKQEYIHEVGTIDPVGVKEGLSEPSWKFAKSFITKSGFDLLTRDASGYLSAFQLVGLASGQGGSGNNFTVTASGCKAEEWKWKVVKDGIIAEDVQGRCISVTISGS